MATLERDGITYEGISPLNRGKRAVIEGFCNTFVPAKLLRRIVSRSQSPLIAESFRRPGSWQSMRIVYENANPVDYLDRMALRNNPISIETRNRRKLVVPKLAQMLRECRQDGLVNVLGVGAGPGVLIQEAILQSGLGPGEVQAYLFDLDPEAGTQGRELASRNGLADRVAFFAADAREIAAKLPDVHPHVVKVVGLLEYLTDDEVVALLSTLRDVMSDGGRLLTHGFDDRFQAGRSLRRMFGLTHNYRTGQHIDELLKRAGFNQISRDETPLGVYPIRIATR